MSRTAAQKLSSALFCTGVFPVPRLVEVRLEAEMSGVLHKPAIDMRPGLKGAILIFGVNRLATNVEVERPPG